MKHYLKELNIKNIEEVATKEYATRIELFKAIEENNKSVKIDYRTSTMIVEDKYYCIYLKKVNKNFKLNSIVDLKGHEIQTGENTYKVVYDCYKLEY